MSIKDLFNSTKYLSKTSVGELTSSIESELYVQEYITDRDRFVPQVDFSDPKQFAKFGSAEKYYLDSIEHIYDDYPFDGSKKEALEWHNSASYMDKYIFEKCYPRFNGHVKFSPNGWGTNSGMSGYNLGNPATKEYIVNWGGPHTGSSGGYVGANIYDVNTLRVSNLRLGGDLGNTVEFWLKKDAIVPAASEKEVIFDLWNQIAVNHGAGSEYGRFLVYLSNASGDSTPSILVTYVSGTISACTNQVVGYTICDDTWKHYAISVKNDSSNLLIKLYINGVLSGSTNVTAGAINEVTGGLKSFIGAIQTAIDTVEVPVSSEGYGKLSGSLDDFRFWKRYRDAENIGRNWFTQIGGGANTKDGNTSLGFYYKFNEGVTQTSSIDSIVLDYSGRLSHGKFIGYDSDHRGTGSAMVISNASSFEFKDPTIYSFHPDVTELISQKSQTGSYYDHSNTTCLYYHLPAWIIEEDEERESYNARNLTQILGQYFDNLYLQISSSIGLRNINYDNLSGSNKPYPFVARLLESKGFSTPEIFSDVSTLSQLASRDEKFEFENKLHDIKNLIYQNIYNNLSYLYKTKGTINSIRNLIRCFGIDDELVKLNLYANNTTLFFDDNYKSISTKKKCIDFNNVDRFGATIYQYTASGNPNSFSYISSSGPFLNYEASGSALTVESSFIFPKKFDGNSNFYFETPFLSASLFGMHTVKQEDAAIYDTTWASSDVANFQVYAVREKLDSKHVQFVLTSSGYVPIINSDLFTNVYDNEKWTLAVKIRPQKYPMYDLISGSSASVVDNYFTIEFYGVSTILDRVVHEFSVSGSINHTFGSAILDSPKRLYVGAHRTNFTGSLLANTDVKAYSSRVWLEYLEDEEIKSHNIDIENYGVDYPSRNIVVPRSCYYKKDIPKIETLALNWDFETVTGSDSNGRFYVSDISSGSIKEQSRNGWLSSIVEKQHVGRGDFFLSNEEDVVDVEYVFNAKQKIPEVLDHDGMIQVLTQDDINFTKDSRPISFFFAIEKSMYQTVSEEMLNWFATVVDFNNLIGMPVNRYRIEYKDLTKLRQLFFEKVGNTPDVEKYLDYYKWFDSSLIKMIQQLVPASADISDHMENVIESHILERNKYWTKFPTLEMKFDDPETGMKGINELLYDWNHGHHPETHEQDKNCFHWKQRELRTDTYLSSVIAGINATKELIHSASISSWKNSLTTPTRFSIDKKEIKGGVNFNQSKKSPTYIKTLLNNNKKNTYLNLMSASLQLSNCKDDADLGLKRKYESKVFDSTMNDYFKGEIVLPLNVMSSSVKSGYNKNIQDVNITNLHHDYYLDGGEMPMQGPFTEKYVGGHQHRHIRMNSGSSLDTQITRPEAFKLYRNSTTGDVYFYSADTSGSSEYTIHTPLAKWTRDGLAKRPLNIKNILNANYSKTYEYIQTSGRKVNNKAFVISGGFSPIVTTSTYITGVTDYAKPSRGRHESVFVERFSAPGGPEVAGDSDGGVGLDVDSAEYSVYNSLNYRNLRVRTALQTLLTRHCGQFGTDSIYGAVYPLTYETSASFHKFQRNNRKKIIETVHVPPYFTTSSVYDNWHIQHCIPANDTGYYWITSSMKGTIWGYATGSEEMTFASASLSGSNIEGVAYIGNLSGYNSSSYDTSNPYHLNLILGNRDGLYQYPSWKQLRSGEKQIIRNQRKNNIIQYLEPPNTKIKASGSNRYMMTPIRGEIISSFREAPLTTKYKPLIHELTIDNDGIKNQISLQTSYSNILSTFANSELSNKLKSSKEDMTMYNRLLLQYNNPQKMGKENGVESLQSLEYKEVVFPSDYNTFLKEIRERENFTIDYWNSNRVNRISYVSNSQGFGVPYYRPIWSWPITLEYYSLKGQSIWPLDGRYESWYLPIGNVTDFNLVPWTWTDGEGELQNKYSTFYDDSTIDPTLPGNTVKRVVRFGYWALSYEPGKGYTPIVDTIQSYNHRIELNGTGSNLYYPSRSPGDADPAENDWDISTIYWENTIGKTSGDVIYFSMWVMPLTNSLEWTDSTEFSDIPSKQTLFAFGTGTMHCFLITGSNTANADVIPHLRNIGFSASWGNSGTSTPYQWVTKDNPITIDEWHHIGVKYDRTAMPADPTSAVTIYIDGVACNLIPPPDKTGAPDSWVVASEQSISVSGCMIGNDWYMSGGLSQPHQWPYEGYMCNFAIGNRKNTDYKEGHPSCLWGEWFLAGDSYYHWWPLGDGVGFVHEQQTDFDVYPYGDSLYSNILEYMTSSTDCIRRTIYGSNGTIKYFSHSPYTWPRLASNNIFYDMNGRMHGFATASMFQDMEPWMFGGESNINYTKFIAPNIISNEVVVSSSDGLSEISGVRYPQRLLGIGQTRTVALDSGDSLTDVNWSKRFRVGALYARPTTEYLQLPWPNSSLSTVIGQVHFTGNLIIAGDTQWYLDSWKEQKPFYDSYREYNDDIRSIAKDFSLIPEFRISENMDYYLNTKYGNFYDENDNMLSLVGGLYSGSSENNFYKIYSHGDFLNYFDILDSDHKEIGNVNKLALRCGGYLKLLPYEGFYPVNRTLQLAQLFSQSYGDNVKPYTYGNLDAMTSSWRAFLSPFFAPGILFNSIKSGLAVDYPIYTEPFSIVEDYKSGPGGKDLFYKITSVYLGSNSELDGLTLGEIGLYRGTTGLYGSSYRSRLNCTHFTYWNGDSIVYTWPGENTNGGYPKACPIDYSNVLDISLYLTRQNILNTFSSDEYAEFKTCLAGNFSKRIPFGGLVEPESYLAKGIVYDMNPEHSCSLLLDRSNPNTNQAAFWDGKGKLNYKLAMHNFLAEVPSFFLKDGKMSTFVSKPFPPEGIVITEQQANDYYGMDIVVNNSKCHSLTDWYRLRTQERYEPYNDDFMPISDDIVEEIKGTHTTMYSRDSVFGPAWVYPGTHITSSWSIYHSHYGYEPFTPSYQNGFGLARLLFYPYKGAGLYTLDDIQSHINVSYIRMPTNRTGSAAIANISDLLEYQTAISIDENILVSGSSAFFAREFWKNNYYDVKKGPNNSCYVTSSKLHHYVKSHEMQENFSNWMQLSASIELFGKTKIDKVSFERGYYDEYVPSQIDKDSLGSYDVWTIQPKWETPIFNFKNATVSQPTYGSGSTAKGMWHQYGDFPTNSEGVWMSIADLPNAKINSKIECAEQYLFDEREENIVSLKNTNAYVTLYIKDRSKLIGSFFILDDTKLSDSSGGVDYGLVAGTAQNIQLARNIANAINSSYCQNDDGNSLGPGLVKYTNGRTLPLKHRFTASAFIPDIHPWINNEISSSNSNDPVAAVRIEINDIGYPYSNKGLYSRYPNYFASGEKGNEVYISFWYENSIRPWSSNEWMLEGGKDTTGTTKIYGDRVFFTGGKSPKYKVKSLADLLGFQKISKRLGELEDKKEIKEAVVAIPYILKNNETTFFKIPRRTIDIASGKVKKQDNENVGDSVIQMVNKMKNYVIPPRMDFITNDRIDPFIMYIFEFSYNLDKEDLANIWQNVMPKISKKTEYQEQIVSHDLNVGELFDGKFENVQWLVFKIKQKANWNYFSITADSTDDSRFKFDFNIGSKDSTKEGKPDFSYNWPYDFFSLVELAKIEAGIKIEGKKK